MENLLKFPQSTFVDKLIPKSKFIKASDTPTNVRNFLTEEFEQIRLLYVLRADTLNIESGKEVSEIDVFYFRSKQEDYTIKSFCNLDTLIPRHTLYIIEHKEKFDVLMQFKRRMIVSNMPKWTCEVLQIKEDIDFNNLGLRIEGMDLDRVYFNFLSKISGYRVDNSKTLKEIKILEDEILKKQKQIEVLQKQIRKEPQFNVQIELNTKARTLKKEIAELNGRLNKLND